MCVCMCVCLCVCVCVWTCVSLRRLRVKPQCSPPRHHRRRQLHLWLLFLVLKEAHKKCPQAPSLRTRNPTTSLWRRGIFAQRDGFQKSPRCLPAHTSELWLRFLVDGICSVCLVWVLHVGLACIVLQHEMPRLQLEPLRF